MASTSTKTTTVRDKLNSAIEGKQADANKLVPRGELLAAMLAANTAVATTGVVTPAAGTYTQADQTALANCVLALVAAVAKLLGGLTEVGITVTSDKASLAQAPTTNGLFQVIATTVSGGTATGPKSIVTDPAHTLVAGEVYWDGLTGLTFAAVDLVTACSVFYAKSDLSQKVSCLLPQTTP